MAPDTLNKVKAFIRISHTKLDQAITDDIEACLADLEVHGIVNKNDADPLILNAIKLWCKAIYTDDTAKATEWQSRYVTQRNYLKSAEGYGWEAPKDE